MAIPDYQQIMLPLLKLTNDGREWSLREAVQAIGREFKLTPAELEERIPSQTMSTIYNRVGWARTYLAKAKLLTRTRRGFFQIADAGRALLATNPASINSKFLTQYPAFNEFLSVKRTDESEESVDSSAGGEISTLTPEEVIEAAHAKLRTQLADELLESILAASPIFFENLVLDLLVAMGYGGNRRDAAQATKRSGDDGIDGIIKEDRLGLDAIYVQAKRWARDRTVGRPDIQQFSGSLQGNRARKGIFITTAGFSRDAREFVERVEAKIVLIDGPTLAQLMIDHGIGVSTSAVYEVKRIDSDYFVGE